MMEAATCILRTEMIKLIENIRNGSKTIELRLNDAKRQSVQIGVL